MDSKDFEDIYYKCQNNPNLPDIKLGKFSAKNYRSLGVKDVAHSVKSDNPDILKKWIGIKKIADHIINQNILTPKDTIIPAPQHTGRAEYTLEIAKIVSEQTGCKIADVLGCVPRDTLYNLKKRHGSSSITDSGIYLLNNKFPKYNVWFLDNVTATGTTFNDARKLIPHIKPLIYSISPRLKVKMKNRKPYFIRESFGVPKVTYKVIENALYQWYMDQLDFCSAYGMKEMKWIYDQLFNIVKASPKPSFGLVNEIAQEITKRGYDASVFKKNIYNSIKESKDMENKIKALVSKIEEYKDIVSNSWIPMPWEIAYSKVPEGLKLTIDTDEWFDEENPLGHLIDFILDIYDSDYNSSVKELTGINVYSDVDFLGGEKSGYATYLIKNNESSSLKEAKLEEGPWPKWKQRILDDSNSLSEEVENSYTGDYWDNKKLRGLSLEDILSIVKKANKKFGFSELQEMHVAINIWKGVHDDEIGISKWASDEEKEEYYAHKFNQEISDKCRELNHKMNKEIWPALEEEYQTKYGRKRKPQPYIKDPTDASEIFDKVYQLRHENRNLKMDFEKIYKSANQ